MRLRPPLAVTGYGMMSALGGAQTACAAARAGMSRNVTLPFEIEDAAAFENVPVTGSPAGRLTEGFSEVGLVVRLAALALADLFERVELGPADIAKTAIIVNLPGPFHLSAADEVRAARAPAADDDGGAEVSDEDAPQPSAARFAAAQPLYRSVVAKAFRALGRPAPPPALQRLLFGDQAGIGPAIAEAHRLLAAREAAACIVGGVDSLVDAAWLQACEDLQILKTPLRPVGLIPGEASAFLLVEPAGKRLMGPATLATIDFCAAGKETSHRFSEARPNGVVMAGLLASACRELGVREASLICDLNGDEARAEELGTVMVRTRADLVPVETLVPAISFGDTRAAAGFVNASVALHALARKAARSERFFVCASGDDGSRALLAIAGPDQGSPQP